MHAHPAKISSVCTSDIMFLLWFLRDNETTKNKLTVPLSPVGYVVERTGTRPHEVLQIHMLFRGKHLVCGKTFVDLFSWSHAAMCACPSVGSLSHYPATLIFGEFFFFIQIFFLHPKFFSPQFFSTFPAFGGQFLNVSYLFEHFLDPSQVKHF